ncbi:MAG TPA: ABC transporter ATP-binding protein [Geminicoccus sp.]|jgi:putative hydroxymethylpyrimidine transport system ATP-binding protein|uniref:ABC transporter ATP-binding protein n=1 Tax=Geminicoccus sp. TaxID=2024832 RepID=UPI002E31B9B4|nr:ABC transporter ATP-binding protein [Geminicoccus sp.]HEX2527257.1 ABC transporter ATP-binding protein [Geminicoccus sp.]
MQISQAPPVVRSPEEPPRLLGPEVEVEVPHLVYGGRPVFQDLRLRLPAGKWTCLLGPSGVGKTSLLRLIAGLEAGAVVRPDPGRLVGKIALMAQQDLLLPWLNVRDNVLLGHRLRGRSRDAMKVLAAEADALLARVGLAGKGDASPLVFSGGMRQRVALARTLIEHRPVVLMDEPFSALDAVTRHRLQDLAAELLADRTVLLVTHHPLEAIRLGHRIWVMAGNPAKLRGPIEPSGPTPRDPADPGAIRLQSDLMKELLASAELVETQ